MPKETTNYSFKKPLYTENADIAVINENLDETALCFLLLGHSAGGDPLCSKLLPGNRGWNEHLQNYSLWE